MSESKQKSANTFPLNLDLPEDLGKRMNAHILKVSCFRGKMPFGIKTTIALRAIEEYLDKHENDEKIDYSRPTGNRKS